MKNIPQHLLILLVFLITAISCDNPRSPNYYTIKNRKTVLNYSTFRGQEEDSLKTESVIPVLSGDLIVGEYFFLKASGHQNKNFDFSDTTGLLPDGSIYSLKISELANKFPLLDNNKINKLELLDLDEFPTEQQFSMLEKIAQQNKKISISLGDVESDTTLVAYNEIITRLLALFDPPIFGMSLNANNVDLLKTEDKLEVLMISMETTDFELPHLTELKSLIILGDTIGNNFLVNNPQIENLSILECSTVDTSILSHLPELRSLTFPFCETLNLAPIGKMKNLNRLILDGDSVINIGALEELDLLRWLHFPNKTTQSQFDSVTGFNQKLELAEICGDGHINDLSSLKECMSLKGLLFYGDNKMKAMKGLNDLRNLKYLSLPEDSYADTAYLALMKKNFPNTTIVPNSGVCLGSGWILLLIPLVLLFHFISRRNIA